MAPLLVPLEAEQSDMMLLPPRGELTERVPRLAPLKARRDAFYATRRSKRATSNEDCSVDFHVAALRRAGFVEAGTVWQQLDNYVIFGRRAS